MMGADMGDAVARAGGEGDAFTRLGESYVKVGVAAEQSSASKHGAWGKVVIAGVGFWALANTATAWANAAGSGTSILAANGSRVTFTEGPKSLADGVNANVFSDSASIPATGVTQPGGQPVSSSGDHIGDINVTSSPIFMQSDKFDFNNVGDFGVGQFGGDSNLGPTPNISNDPNINGTATGESVNSSNP